MRSEQGHSLIETVLLGLLFLVPLVWLLETLSDVHLAALATTNAVREAGFEATRSPNRVSAEKVVERTVTRSFRNHGLQPELAEISLSPATDFGRGASIRIIVSYPVPIIRAPYSDGLTAASLSVRAEHVARIDPFRSRS
jgi:hypothetical protein